MPPSADASTPSRDVVLAGAVRTPSGRFQGGLSAVPAPQLGATVGAEALARAGLEPDLVDEAIFGNVIAAGLGQNPARQAALAAGVPVEVGAFTVNKVCGSSLKAAMLATQAVQLGDADVVLVGGFESMTRAPHLLGRGREVRRLGTFTALDLADALAEQDVDPADVEIEDAMQEDGLRDAYEGILMGTTGDIVADRHDVSRTDADAFALRSHRRAAKAWDDGAFKREVVPVEVEDPDTGEARTVAEDETIRRDTSAEALAGLAPHFADDGVVTAGNASQIADGAAALVVMSGEAADEHGVEPLARVLDHATAGVEPRLVMEAPIPGVRRLLDRNELAIDDVALVEHNEAFASASCAVRAALEVPDDRFNVRGGAVALGHPLGASGARILTTLLYAMQDEAGEGDLGVATLCLGGGNSVQMLVEAL